MKIFQISKKYWPLINSDQDFIGLILEQFAQDYYFYPMSIFSLANIYFSRFPYLIDDIAEMFVSLLVRSLSGGREAPEHYKILNNQFEKLIDNKNASKKCSQYLSKFLKENI